MTKKTEKQGFEDVKKTVKAHGIIDEKEAEKMAEKTEEVTEKLIESENEEAKEEDTLKVIEAVVEGKVEAVPVKIERGMFGIKSREESISGWEPKTKLGREVKNEKIRDIDEILIGM